MRGLVVRGSVRCCGYWLYPIRGMRRAPSRFVMGWLGCYSLMVYIMRLWAGTSTVIFLLTFTSSFTGLTGCLS